MTTICFRDGFLAADTLISYTTITNGAREKITKCGDYMVAMAGAAYLRKALEDWVTAGCSEDVPAILLDNQDKFSTLIVDREGRAHEFDNGFLIPVYADYTAIGSGALLALGAMAHGADAVEAVMASSRHDKNTGGPVSAVHFSELN
jgi:hypothetical protein